MEQANPDTPEIQEDEQGISIWLALIIAIALLCAGILLIQSSPPINIIPSTGQSKEAFYSDLMTHALPNMPDLDLTTRNPQHIIDWQKKQQSPSANLQHLGLRNLIGASSLSWNKHPVTLIAANIDAKPTLIYTIKAPSFTPLLPQGSMMTWENQGRESISWQHNKQTYVAIPLQEKTHLPSQWKSWLLKQ